MAEIGLFPLELVLLPTERVPLHIFEPRYKELIRDCISDDPEFGPEFGLVLADEDGQREIGTRAAVLDVLQIFDDGRMNIVVEGRERFRIVELTEGRSFTTGEVEPLEDVGDEPSPDDETERALTLFRQLVEVAEAEEVDEPPETSEALSFELAARIDIGPGLKQELLELRSERERLERVSELCQQAISGLTLEREVRSRASTNGKVSRPPAAL